MIKCKISDAHGRWLGAEIDTDEFMAATLDEDKTLDVMIQALAEQEDTDAQGVWSDFLEAIGYAEVCGDNTYNNENDLSSTLDWYVAMPKNDHAEWYYSDMAILLVKKHLGGDVRCNYRNGKIYRLDGNRETAFLTLQASWAIQEGTDERGNVLTDEMKRSIDEKWETGYSSCPSSALEKDTEEILEHDAESATLMLKNGWKVKVSPWWVG